MKPGRLQVLDWLLIATAAVSLSAVVWGARRWWDSNIRNSATDAELASVRELVAAVERARALPPVLAESAPAGDQLSMVNDTLGSAGLPASVLRRVQSEADGVVERIEGVTLPIRRSAMRVELDGVTLQELGRFLAAWRTQHPGWTPVLLNLSIHPESGRAGASSPPGTSLSRSDVVAPRWTVSVSMAALYLAPEAQNARSSASDRPSADAPRRSYPSTMLVADGSRTSARQPTIVRGSRASQKEGVGSENQP